MTDDSLRPSQDLAQRIRAALRAAYGELWSTYGDKSKRVESIYDQLRDGLDSLSSLLAEKGRLETELRDARKERDEANFFCHARDRARQGEASDFELSYPEVRAIDDLRFEKGRLEDALQDARKEIAVDEQLLVHRDELLRAIPECPAHGSCVPYALEWIERMKQAEAALQDAQPLDPPIFDSRDRAAAILQSWTNAIRQSPEDDRFALSIIILRTAPGQDPEHFTIETTEP